MLVCVSGWQRKIRLRFDASGDKQKFYEKSNMYASNVRLWQCRAEIGSE